MKNLTAPHIVTYAKNVRARRHDHLTDRYIGPAHSNCNLNYKYSHYIPVVFHNLSISYNAHFVIKEITTVYEEQIDLLPIKKEKLFIYEECQKHQKQR